MQYVYCVNVTKSTKTLNKLKHSCTFRMYYSFKSPNICLITYVSVSKVGKYVPVSTPEFQLGCFRVSLVRETSTNSFASRTYKLEVKNKVIVFFVHFKRLHGLCLATLCVLCMFGLLHSKMVLQEWQFDQLVFTKWTKELATPQDFEDILNIASKVNSILEESDQSPVAIQCL